jgi:hypothetical protein
MSACGFPDSHPRAALLHIVAKDARACSHVRLRTSSATAGPNTWEAEGRSGEMESTRASASSALLGVSPIPSQVLRTDDPHGIGISYAICRALKIVVIAFAFCGKDRHVWQCYSQTPTPLVNVVALALSPRPLRSCSVLHISTNLRSHSLWPILELSYLPPVPRASLF